MLLSFLSLSAALFACAVASPLVLPGGAMNGGCPYPNGSDTSIFTYSCATTADSIDVRKIVVTDTSGNPLYPIDPRKAFILDLQSFNNGVEIQDNHVEVHVFEYMKGWASSDCHWQELPTFGLLGNIDGCEFAHNCPLTKGELSLKIKLDLSSFSAIISLLSKDTPLQLSIRMRNYNPGDTKHEEIACVVAQLRVN